MDDTFDQLDQAAVAGAEGTVWPMPELGSSTCFPVFDTFAAEDSSDATIHVQSSNPIPVSMPIPIPTSSTKSEPVDASMVDAPASPSVSSSATTSTQRPRPSHIHTSHYSNMHPSRAFIPMPSPRKRRAAAIDGLSTSPTSIAIGSDMDHDIQNDYELDADLEVDRKESNEVYCSPDRKGKSVRIGKNVHESRSNGADTSMCGASPSSPASACTSPLSGHDLTDLSGTTAARSRKMTDEERKIMLHKRRLRNRASAARSREKRSRTLNELTTEVEDLMKKSARLAQQATQAVEEARKLRARNVVLMNENKLLKADLKL